MSDWRNIIETLPEIGMVVVVWSSEQNKPKIATYDYDGEYRWIDNGIDLDGDIHYWMRADHP